MCLHGNTVKKIKLDEPPFFSSILPQTKKKMLDEHTNKKMEYAYSLILLEDKLLITLMLSIIFN